MKNLLFKLIILTALILFSTKIYCQVDSLNFGPEPIGGINKLALVYYKISFTKEQRKSLQDVEIEFIYSVDENGRPILEKINGVDDKDILDSLQKASAHLPQFIPQTVNGKKQASFYFMRMQFPYFKLDPSKLMTGNESIIYKSYKYEDFEYIHYSGERLDIIFGGMMNYFSGSQNDYVGLGGGFKTDLLYAGKNGYGGGMVMNFYSNPLKKNYPINSNREQNQNQPSLLLGIAFTKDLLIKEKSEINLQIELNYAIQNVTASLGQDDRGWTQLRGFSPGILANYLLKFGKNYAGNYYGTPSVFNNYINITGALRPVFYNLKQANGIMLEFGVAYRLVTRSVDEYKLKENQ